LCLIAKLAEKVALSLQYPVSLQWVLGTISVSGIVSHLIIRRIY